MAYLYSFLCGDVEMIDKRDDEGGTPSGQPARRRRYARSSHGKPMLLQADVYKALTSGQGNLFLS
jgi:hypothetical protein